jgi:hypothetical protein
LSKNIVILPAKKPPRLRRRHPEAFARKIHLRNYPIVRDKILEVPREAGYRIGKVLLSQILAFSSGYYDGEAGKSFYSRRAK